MESSAPVTIQKGAIKTGGPLNFLNEEMGCNQPHVTLKVMKVVDYHRPVTPDALKDLIKQHVGKVCGVCGEKSHGTVEQFGTNLFNAQAKHRTFLQNNRRFSETECKEFMFNLFCVAPLRGIWAEEESQKLILNGLEAATGNEGWFEIRRATPAEDFKYAVDYVVEAYNEKGDYYYDLVGIQVKPLSVLKRSDVMKQNHEKNKRFENAYNCKVLYHFYDPQLVFNAKKTEELIGQILNL